MVTSLACDRSGSGVRGSTRLLLSRSTRKTLFQLPDKCSHTMAEIGSRVAFGRGEVEPPGQEPWAISRPSLSEGETLAPGAASDANDMISLQD
jgi:hypothetical protein